MAIRSKNERIKVRMDAYRKYEKIKSSIKVDRTVVFQYWTILISTSYSAFLIPKSVQRLGGKVKLRSYIICSHTPDNLFVRKK